MDFCVPVNKMKASNIRQLGMLLLSHLRRVSETYSNLKTKYQGTEIFRTRLMLKVISSGEIVLSQQVRISFFKYIYWV